jgi:DNA-binding IclR family transcriptional regulator
VTVLRRLQDLVKQGYVERVGNAYRVTDKVNIPDLQRRLQRRIDMIIETATKLSELALRLTPNILNPVVGKEGEMDHVNDIT